MLISTITGMTDEALIPYDTTLFVRDHCLCLHAQRAARALARRFDDALRPLGLTNGQFSLLMALNRPEPPPMGPVAAVLAMDRTTLTAALKPLERRGLVVVEPDPRDRRGRLLRLTREGRRLLTEAFPIWQDTHAKLDAELSAVDMNTLRTGMMAIA
jgi:DNA-binding MarR family transcriptional regulator